jgi:hypothetical protein
MRADQLYFAVLMGSIPIFAVYLGTSAILFGYLRRNHASTWVALGEPRFTRRLGGGWPYVGFLLRREYISLNDPWLTRLATLARTLVFVGPCLVGVMFVLFILLITQSGLDHHPNPG